MGRVLAIDYGTKRVGLAVSDEEQIIASGLKTVHSTEVIDFLKKYVEQFEIDCFVLGEPKTLSNQATDATESVQNFSVHLRRLFPSVKLERVDERFTSVLAVKTMIDSGMSKKKRQNKSLVDEISATIILQDYLEQKKNGFR